MKVKVISLVALLAPTYFFGFAYPATLAVIGLVYVADKYLNHKYVLKTHVELNQAFIDKIKEVETTSSARLRELEDAIKQLQLAHKMNLKR